MDVDESSSSGSSSGGDSSTSLDSHSLVLSYNSSSLEGSEGSDDEAAAVMPFMYEPIVSSGTDEEDSNDSGGVDPRLANLDW